MLPLISIYDSILEFFFRIRNTWFTQMHPHMSLKNKSADNFSRINNTDSAVILLTLE